MEGDGRFLRREPAQGIAGLLQNPMPLQREQDGMAGRTPRLLRLRHFPVNLTLRSARAPSKRYCLTRRGDLS